MATPEVTLVVRKGQTAAVTLQLLEADGSPHNLADAAKVELVLAATDGQGKSYVFSTQDTPPKLSVQDAAQGKIAFVPDTLATEESPYRGYVRRYYSADTWAPWPSDGDLVVHVLPAYTA
jgi:hypothetical protein